MKLDFKNLEYTYHYPDDTPSKDIAYEEALDIALGTWKDNDMTRDMLMIPNNIQLKTGSYISITGETKYGRLALMAGLWNRLPDGVVYDDEGNRKEVN